MGKALTPIMMRAVIIASAFIATAANAEVTDVVDLGGETVSKSSAEFGSYKDKVIQNGTIELTGNPGGATAGTYTIGHGAIVNYAGGPEFNGNWNFNIVNGGTFHQTLTGSNNNGRFLMPFRWGNCTLTLDNGTFLTDDCSNSRNAESVNFGVIWVNGADAQDKDISVSASVRNGSMLSIPNGQLRIAGARSAGNYKPNTLKVDFAVTNSTILVAKEIKIGVWRSGWLNDTANSYVNAIFGPGADITCRQIYADGNTPSPSVIFDGATLRWVEGGNSFIGHDVAVGDIYTINTLGLTVDIPSGKSLVCDQNASSLKGVGGITKIGGGSIAWNRVSSNGSQGMTFTGPLVVSNGTWSSSLNYAASAFRADGGTLALSGTLSAANVSLAATGGGELTLEGAKINDARPNLTLASGGKTDFCTRDGKVDAYTLDTLTIGGGAVLTLDADAAGCDAINATTTNVTASAANKAEVALIIPDGGVPFGTSYSLFETVDGKEFNVRAYCADEEVRCQTEVVNRRLVVTTCAVSDVVAKQRYPWNGLVDITCKVSGINGTTNGLKFAVAAVMPDSGAVSNASHFVVVRDGENTADVKVRTNGNYRLVWDAQADLGSVRYTNMVVRVTLKKGRPEVQLWEGGSYWATTNVGAEEPWECGCYFWWGGIVGYKRENNAWVATDGSSSSFSFVVDNTPTYKTQSALLSKGWVVSKDDTYVLAPEHDAAHIHWGEGWRMPTYQELSDLNNKCVWTWTTINGVNGYIVRGCGDYALNSIFLPSAGYGTLTSLENAGLRGCYWSSVPCSGIQESLDLYFHLSYHGTSYDYRSYGQSVRPVRDGLDVSVSMHACDSMPFVIDSMMVSPRVDSVPWNAAWVGGDSNATVVIMDNGSEVKRATGAGELSLDVGCHELLYRTYIANVEQAESYTATVYRCNCACELGDVPLVETKAAKAETCSEDGWTHETKCGRCNTILEVSMIRFAGHVRIETKAAKAATCTEDGWTREVKCSRCNEVLEASTTIPKLGHVEVVTKPAVEPDVSTVGLTAEISCSRCGVVLQEQVVIPPEVRNVTAKQRYPWNGLVDITCKVVGINGTTNGLEFAVATVMPDSGAVSNVSHFGVGGAAEVDVHTNGNYWLVWNAQADLGSVRYTNMVVRVTLKKSHPKVQLWDGGPYWATTNIGADKPWEYGYYFWWGDTLGYKRENNAWVATDGSSSNFSFGSGNTPTYNKTQSTLQSEGWIASKDGTYTLAPEHDVAQVHWGGAWRMPTYQELFDLNSKCDWTWTTTNGVNGYIVRGRDDYASYSIFLPCAGYGYGTSLYYAGSYGYYWSSVPDSDSSCYAYELYFLSSYHRKDFNYRSYGHSVRPVQGFTR